MALNEIEPYNSGKIKIPARRTLDIIGLLAISFFLFVTGYPLVSGASVFTADIDKINDDSVNAILIYINSLLHHQITKTQLILFIPFLLVFIAWAKFIIDFLKNNSGLVIDETGIIYTHTIFRDETEDVYRHVLRLEWSEIDKFEIEKEVNLRFLTLLKLKVYLKPGMKPKTKAGKFFVDIASRIAGIANIDTSKIHQICEIKRLNADMNEVKKILDKHLNDFRKHKERMRDFEKISS
jgi:hypothetical protein